MTPILLKTAAAIAAAAGLAYTAADDFTAGSPYEGAELSSLDARAIEGHAAVLFARADRNEDRVIDVHEFAALSIVSAELARLNGFVVIETHSGPQTLRLVANEPASLGFAEHARINAVSRATFYAFAGEDVALSADEFLAYQKSQFAAADFDQDGALEKGELSAYAKRQALVATAV
ncbi:MAG: hypothetical protein AAFW81_01300 [Pseudomonadota bacterium]